MRPVNQQGPQAALLPDGKRLHLHHGPIDLIIEASGAPYEVGVAYKQARQAFENVLTDLVPELPLLRTPVDQLHVKPAGIIAQRMLRAVEPHVDQFVTPMAAVAGAVAEHILASTIKGRKLQRAYVNNGGDIALHIEASRSFDIGIAANPVSGNRAASVTVSHRDLVRGVATSGWHGRSHSLGIADAVTVLAPTAASADVAATLIANAVDLPGSKKIERTPANELAPDSDLGARLATTAVGELTAFETSEALERGVAAAASMLQAGIIEAAFLLLQHQTRTVHRPESSCLSAANLMPNMKSLCA
jgi:ApbE superfamily uncharacterized protein (UPF0280 family)